ncbi:MAG: putative acetyltransferase [Yoonia sp.]|jgi:putative acetyltransferase
MLIRPETPHDHAAIFDLTKSAFAPMSFSDGTEPGAISALRNDGDLTLSLLGDIGEIIGHVAFSPTTISGGKGQWFALGPISVRTAKQRQGIGSTLAAEGLKRLATKGTAGCVLLGTPQVYVPMGFVSDGHLTDGGLHTKFVQYQVLNGSVPQGKIAFAPALQEDHP